MKVNHWFLVKIYYNCFEVENPKIKGRYKMKINYICISDKGLRRTENQDSFWVDGFTKSNSCPERGISGTADSNTFFAVFDAKSEVTRDFPTPPLPETTPITCLTVLFGCRWNLKSFDLQFELQVEQLWVQPSSDMYLPLFCL